MVTHCLLRVRYLGSSAEKTQHFSGRKVHRGISAPAGVTCFLFWASFSPKLLCTGLQKSFCVAAQPGLVSTSLTILSKRASFCHIAVTRLVWVCTLFWHKEDSITLVFSHRLLLQLKCHGKWLFTLLSVKYRKKKLQTLVPVRVSIPL